MSKDRELLQKYLSAIKCLYYEGQDDSICITDIIAEIEAELAKPCEPVAWANMHDGIIYSLSQHPEEVVNERSIEEN
jgi:hypothetical protein